MATLITPYGQEFAVSPRVLNEGFVIDDLDQLVGGWSKAFLLKTGELLLVNSLAGTAKEHGNSKATHLMRYAINDSGGEVRGYALLLGKEDFDFLPRPLQVVLLTGTTNETQTVLLLDNDQEVRSVVALGLERHNFRVIQAGTVDEAMRFCRSYSIEFLVADVSSLQPQSLATLRSLQAARPQARVLLVSGYDRFTVARWHEGLLTGCEFLQKPFSFAVLAQVISQMSMVRELPVVPCDPAGLEG